ncbi:MAG TPA: M42 family metallopeptidase [Firmicutes bacterium]|nr:M42 family metallopeptidase [Bacillota bacterium]
MDRIKEFLQKLSVVPGISGYEAGVARLVRDTFTPYVDEIRTDKLGNVICLKKGQKGMPLKVMLAAHMDEIGFIVSDIKDGFVKVHPIGGIDPRTLVNQEVVISGRREVPGVFAAFAPHLSHREDIVKGVTLAEDLFIDTGLDAETAAKLLRIGDMVTIKRDFCELAGGLVAGKAFDDRAGIALVLACLMELKTLVLPCDLFFAATVQEEVGVRGAATATFGIVPDIGIAVDVCHGDFPGAPKHDTSELGKGPVITWGPNINPFIFHKLKQTAEKYDIPFQEDTAPGPTGTDARAIQITREGIATGLVSIPLRYMHTSVETLNLKDITWGGRLLAYFLKELVLSDKEELKCF